MIAINHFVDYVDVFSVSGYRLKTTALKPLMHILGD